MSIVDLFARDESKDPVTGRVYGAVIGIVTNLDDPDGQGRVKLKFPWLNDDSESTWARIVSFMAGPDRGAVFRPEVGDEVLVVFEHGDMRFPYVLGGLWNAQDTMPAEKSADGDNDVRLIKSRSGHQVILDDTSGSEKVTIIDMNGNSIEMSSDGIVIKSDAIKIGSENSAEGLVLGSAFMELYNAHTHPTGVGPSGPPPTPMQEGSHVSSKHKTE